MGLSITLPGGIRQRVQDIAAQKGEKVENVVITAVLHYLAREQRAKPSRDVSDVEWSQRLYRGFKDRLRQRYSSLGDLPREQVVTMMERLSEKVVEGMAFATWQEAEAFMRGGVPSRHLEQEAL